MRPVDLATALYLAVAAVPLPGPHRAPGWPAVFLLHVAGIAAIGTLLRRERRGGLAAGAWGPGSGPGVGFGWVRWWYPLLLVPALYGEIPLLNQAFRTGYFDPWVVRAEERLFGGQPARELAALVPSPLLSELLHGAYLSYYFLVYVPPLLLYLRGRRRAYGETLFAVMSTFYLSYLLFILLPVQGPRYLWPAPEGAFEGPVRRLALGVLEAGSSRGAAFPSSHVAVAAAQAVAALRHQPRVGVVVAVLAVGLAVGAVYGGFHYATDVVAGAVLGVGVAAAAGRVYRRLHPTGAGGPRGRLRSGGAAA